MILATACPYCIAMFEDSIRTLNADDKIKVMDVSELFLESLEINIDEPAVDVCATN
jgi:Fe-S oxidoreductase